MPQTLVLTRPVTPQTKAASPYLLVPFEVPEGVTRFDLALTYPRHDGDCVIDLGLGNPELGPFPSVRGLVGWSGGARDRVFVGQDGATPGYRPGMAPGTWTVILGLYKLPPETVEARLEIVFDTTPREPARVRPAPRPVRPEPGWYRGDLQSHTFHSDAGGAPEHLHATAQREDLDFLAVTDHNTTTAQAAYFDAASSPGLVFVPAYEFTTASGHGNVYGAREAADFRCETGADVLDMVARLRASGHLFSINHDKPGHPWLWPLPEADCQEVWQAPWFNGNHVALRRWQRRLAEGRRLVAIGGSDFHQPGAEPEGNPATLARPCTRLWCAELSVDGILDAMRAGRSVVTEAPGGPHLVLRAGETMQGGTVPDIAAVEVEVTGAAGETLELWDATGRIASAPIAHEIQAIGLRVAPVRFVRAQIVASATRAARIAEARARLGPEVSGDMEEALAAPLVRALTSPIWLDMAP